MQTKTRVVTGRPVAGEQVDSLEWSNPRLAGSMHQVVGAVRQTILGLACRTSADHTRGGWTRGDGLNALIVLRAAQCAGGETRRTALVAEFVEHVYAALSSHDRVRDDTEPDQTNRAAIKSSNNEAVLTGDYLLAEALRQLADCDDAMLLSEAASALCRICLGQVQFLEARERLVPASRYLAALRLRAGSLPAFAGRAGVATAGGGVELARVFAAFGEDFGVALRVTEEIETLMGEGGNQTDSSSIFGRDRGFPLPLVFAGESDRGARRTLIELAARGEYSADDLSLARQLARQTGAVDRCVELVQVHLDAALTHLAVVPLSRAKAQLIQSARTACEVRRPSSTD